MAQDGALSADLRHVADKTERNALSLPLLQLKDGLDGFAEVFGNFQYKHCRRNIASGLDGVDGLSAYANGVGQFLLGNVFDCPLYFDGILHRPALLMALIVKLNLRIYTR
jgi:hypothetical protein